MKMYKWFCYFSSIFCLIVMNPVYAHASGIVTAVIAIVTAVASAATSIATSAAETREMDKARREGLTLAELQRKDMKTQQRKEKLQSMKQQRNIDRQLIFENQQVSDTEADLQKQQKDMQADLLKKKKTDAAKNLMRNTSVVDEARRSYLFG